MSARGRAEDGFILVVVLVLLMALATLASIYSVYANAAAAESLAPEARLAGEAAIRSGVELAAARLLAVAEAQRPSRGELTTQVGAARLRVVYRAENARVDLNAASRELLLGLVKQLGWPDSAAGGFVDRIIGWRATILPNAPNAELALYHKAGLGYAPRQAPFNSVLELGLVLDLPPALVDRLRPFVTVCSGKSEINVAEADPLILAALPDIARGAIGAVLSARAKGMSGSALVDLLGPSSQGATAQPDQAFRAAIAVVLGQRRLNAEVVFTLKSEAGNPFEILDWKDDFDAPSS